MKNDKKDIKDKKLTYISLFSSAGIGCYGFKMENFDCIATNELIERRINIQRVNNKCKYESGYICGDITKEETKKQLFNQIKLWNEKEKISDIDVIIATPPCQGMSIANHKKNNEINRNSLVIESIKIIKEVKPKIFIFENVSAFMKTACIDIDDKIKSIEEAIKDNLSSNYTIMHEIINFKDHGSCSSRTRTIVIGVRIDYDEFISPIDLFPKRTKERTLKETIGNMKSLTNFGEISSDDIYHSFRIYPEHMRKWIHGLKEGESAFNNESDDMKPHSIVNGKIRLNVNKSGDKYKRQCWNKVGPCIHTRNDQLASQNTIHPVDDRVFSIRELMRLMTIPDSFKWVNTEETILNNLSTDKKRKFLKKEEINIRQSIGEAVATEIFRSIASNIKKTLSTTNCNLKDINKLIQEYNLTDNGNLQQFIEESGNNFSFTTLSKIAELSNAKRNDEEAFYTNKSLINYIFKDLPIINKDIIRVLEPSVGVGNFVPYIISKYSYAKELIIDVIDINPYSLDVLSKLLEKIEIPDNVKINFICHDYLTYELEFKYDLIIGNPPFKKMKASDKTTRIYREIAINHESLNTSSYFIEKSLRYSDNVVMIMPKFVLNTIEYKETREFINKYKISSILDFGENGFAGVLVETVCLIINTINKPSKTKVFSISSKNSVFQTQKYITDSKLPYWIIYRNDYFDKVFDKMEFDIFDVFRDRQITNSTTNNIKENSNKEIWVVKSRNINDNGTIIEHVENYDTFIKLSIAKKLGVYKYFNNSEVYLTPNMTYKPRVCKKPKGILVNGSVAILIPKKKLKLKKKDMLYFSTKEYRDFYRIARNNQTRSLNVDKTSVFFFGKLK